mmetsp:Transcript_10129/g.13953  ORF Transcript_10129/g.13953 Transcript_10129/m.13953 type:complete len:443 (-) Transcript_10129:170-1498(-)|eukprot:CAMPEP_0185251898 /NCGR_PEP_ID=MMETSP1359-20130426/1192_1 /TAXON_ID=552665 /ORGANISM="Bigelowiella longifila, Strain CCMP242" /LENGTH=442 /DNA_ID=CAMNT_0027833957 /DNA_START=54 /DNA_END=1382 /DNA_ORIENTATION=-
MILPRERRESSRGVTTAKAVLLAAAVSMLLVVVSMQYTTGFSVGSGIASLSSRTRGNVALTGSMMKPRLSGLGRRPGLRVSGSETDTYEFPFARIVGQEDMKLSLLLNAVDPKIGGVLIFGDRGTGKSVCIQSMKSVLPLIESIKADPYNSHPTDPNLQGSEVRESIAAGKDLETVFIKTPVIQLPLGATEDKVCGTINMEEALLSGEKKFEPGLLAKANRGILFVDEINLMEDSLVDVVLDSAAGGYNKVEREGISAEHPARYILIATGHPDEGELRPQLLDRFGLFVTVSTIQNSTLCTQMILDRLEFDEDPQVFCEKVEEEQEALRSKIDRARQLLPQVKVPEEHYMTVAEVCGRLGTEGIRGDLACIRAASAAAALDGRTEVTFEDLERVVPLAIGHRLKKDPTDPVFDMKRKGIVVSALRRIADPEAFMRKPETASA